MNRKYNFKNKKYKCNKEIKIEQIPASEQVYDPIRWSQSWRWYSSVHKCATTLGPSPPKNRKSSEWLWTRSGKTNLFFFSNTRTNTNTNLKWIIDEIWQGKIGLSRWSLDLYDPTVPLWTEAEKSETWNVEKKEIWKKKWSGKVSIFAIPLFLFERWTGSSRK